VSSRSLFGAVRTLLSVAVAIVAITAAFSGIRHVPKHPTSLVTGASTFRAGPALR